MIAMASQFDAMSLADGALALSILEARAKSMPEQVDVALGQHSLAVLQGRPNAALEAGARLMTLQPGSQGYLRLRVLDALYAEGDTTAAAAAARRLETLTSRGIAEASITSEPHLSNICALSQWHLSREDTVGIRRAIGTLRGSGQTRGPTSPLVAPPGVCADLLDVWLAVLIRHGAAFQKLERLDSLALTPEVAGDAMTYAPLLLARLFEGIGQPGRALQAVRKRVYMVGWPRYLAKAWREEGRLAELVGDINGARRAYDRYLELRGSPERSVQPEVEQVRVLRAALRTEQAP
jgi:hypothetical protein